MARATRTICAWERFEPTSISAPPWIVASGLRKSCTIEAVWDNRLIGSEAIGTGIILFLAVRQTPAGLYESFPKKSDQFVLGLEMELFSGVYFLNRTFQLIGTTFWSPKLHYI